MGAIADAREEMPVLQAIAATGAFPDPHRRDENVT
jgi:hypothetical protein